MNDDTPLYNSRIIKIKLAYIKRHYPQVDIDAVLAQCNMTRYQVEDPAHWFSQKQTDRFNAIMEKETGNPDFALETGRFANSADGIGLARQYGLGWLSPAMLYLSADKFMNQFSRAVRVTSRRLAPNRVETTFTPKPGVVEKPYQCQNRIGALESLACPFTGRYAHVEHPDCFHKGRPNCRYIIGWAQSKSLTCKSVRNTTGVAGFLACLILIWLLPPQAVALTAGVVLFLTVALSLVATLMENKELQHTIVSQRTAAQEHLENLNVNYNNALLVQEIGQAISKVRQLDSLMESVVNAMARRIDFDRGAILIANGEKTRLQFAAGFGFDADEEILLRRNPFHLNRHDSEGLFVRAFRDRRSFIMEDLFNEVHRWSQRSQAIARRIGVQSLICVPIVYENEPLGILAVDNSLSRRALTQSDMSLLMGIASQTAVCIANAKAFQQLQESEVKHRNILEELIDGYFEVDLRGNFTFFNSSVCRMLGYTRPELKGLNNRHYMDADNARKAYLAFKQVFESGLPHKSQGWQLTRKDGTACHVETLISLIRDSKAQAIGFRGIARDISDRIKAEKEKKRLEAQLQRAHKMEAIGMLAGGVAHDLNNVLSGLVTYPEILLMDLPKDSPLRKPVATIQKSGQKASAIVQDLLTLARRGVPVSEAVNLNLIIQEYLHSPEHQQLLRRHQTVRVAVDLDRALPNMIGSPVHLSKALANIVGNAAEAMPRGGTIRIASSQQFLDRPVPGYTTCRTGNYTVVSITDDGIGISPEDISHIFEPFYTKKVMGHSGSGLGMAVVWGTVEDHAGYIDVHSQPGAGTTFRLYFPVASRVGLPAPPPSDITQYAGHGESVLVVDDILEQREIAVKILDKLGYQAQAVASGKEAVAVVEKQPVDLVILDMIMDTGMDGLETYRAILSVCPSQKAIIVSGFSENETVRSAQRLGAGTYVKKPYTAETIGRAVHAELKGHRTNQPVIRTGSTG